MRIENAEMRETLAALGLVRHTEKEMQKFAAELMRVIAPAMGGRRALEIAEQAALWVHRVVALQRAETPVVAASGA